MMYIFTTLFIILMTFKLSNIKNSASIEELNIELLIITAYGIIIFWCIIGMVNILGGRKVLKVEENKSVHISGAIGRGKTY